MNKYFLASMAMLCTGLMTVSCTDSFEEVNKDPDKPLAEEVPSTNIMAYCQRYASDNLFDEWFDMNEVSGFSGQLSKWMYPQEGYYEFRPTVNNSSWNVCYYVTANLKTIIDNESEKSNMWAAATIFQCQMFQIMSDRWGNIPYSDAFGLEKGNATPKYDEQSAIYPDLLTRLAKAVAVLEADEEGDDIGAGDILFGGDPEAWIKYGNALRLRIAARIANIDPSLAKSTFKAVIDDGNLPLVNDDNAFFVWNNEYPEPWADYFQSRPNEYGVSELMVNTLIDLDDPRLSVYCTPTRTWQAWDGEGEEPAKYAGRQCGLRGNAAVRDFSQIGNRFQEHGALSGFSPWLRSCEVYFALAYAASKGWDVGMSQQAAYMQALFLSLDENGVSPEEALSYVTEGKAAYDGSEDQLFTQWWISLFKNGSEAWSVYRMAPTTTYLFKENKVAPGNAWGSSHNCPPMCYGYPDVERNLNTANCQSSKENDYFWGKQMWWDVRTGLK